VSGRYLLVALCALLAGCAGRLGSRAPAPPPGPSFGPSAPPYPFTTTQPAPQAAPPLAVGGETPGNFPELRASIGAVATYSSPAVDSDPAPTPPPLEEPVETPPADPEPHAVDLPEGVSPVPPFEAPPPIPFHPPTRAPMPRRAVPRPLPPPRVTVSVPGGETCLARLTQAGVPFRTLETTRGIETPIVIDGPIGGIRYHSAFGPMVCDCRFALALATAAPQLTQLGVTEMRFSGAYSYRMSRVGRLSLHAYGLALDVHEIVVEGRTLDVERHFARGIGCGAGPALNHVACKLRDLGLFRELLTPDYNADHSNHFHIGLAPLGPLGDELWKKRREHPPTPQLPVFGEGSRLARSSRDRIRASVSSEKFSPHPKTKPVKKPQSDAREATKDEGARSKRSTKRSASAEKKPSAASKRKKPKTPKRVGALEKGGAS
jgi:hypothetical protein